MFFNERGKRCNDFEFVVTVLEKVYFAKQMKACEKEFQVAFRIFLCHISSALNIHL